VIGGDVRIQLFIDRERTEFVSAIHFDTNHPFAEDADDKNLGSGGGS